MNKARSFSLLLILLFLRSFALNAQSGLTADQQNKIDDAVRKTLTATGVPSASIAVVRDGRIEYLQAYGDAKLDAPKAANPEMRYCIGSISKQFTAAAVLMLVEQGKLSLRDPVSRFIPGLTRGNEVTIRELLSMTSGYQDFWPQDYVPPMMLEPVTPQQILDRWARIPLDFNPGDKWQYSNTNYAVAGLIIEKASGMKLNEFLKQRIFEPLHMNSVTSMHVLKDMTTGPVGYLKYALGPPRPAPKEGKGWMFGAGELAMTAADLARWDISILEGSLLKPASYRELETEVLLNSGVGSRYGLGVGVTMEQGRRVLSHGGEVSGFVAQNYIYPDDREAVVVMTNLDASAAAGQIVKKIEPVIFSKQDENTEERRALARKIFDGLQHGRIDRSLFTANCSHYFSGQAVKDFADSLGPLGPPEEFIQASSSKRGGMGFRSYSVKFRGGKAVRITVRDLPDGKIEQFQVMPE